MKEAYGKRIIAIIAVMTMMTGLLMGCSGDTSSAASGSSPKFTEKDLKGVVDGLDDHYILEGAKGIDYMHDVEYDEDEGIVKDIKADTSDVKLDKPGTYEVTYTVTVDAEALEAHIEAAKKEKAAAADQDDKKETSGNQAEAEDKDEAEDTVKEDAGNAVEDKTEDAVENKANDASTGDAADNTAGNATDEAEDKADGNTGDRAEDKTESKAEDKANDSKEGSGNDVDIEVKKDMEVVDEKKAEELAGKGKDVWTDNNEVIPKAEDTADDTQTGETTEGTDTQETTPEQKAESKTEESNSSAKAPAQPSTPSASTAPAQSSTPSTPSKPAQQQPAHTHTWVTVEATGHYEEQVVQAAWDEPVYSGACICNQCGFTTSDDWKMICHCAEHNHNYYVDEVQTGTTHHPAVTKSVWVQDSAAYQRCSGCGATK